jgi:hypothetical protein
MIRVVPVLVVSTLAVAGCASSGGVPVASLPAADPVASANAWPKFERECREPAGNLEAGVRFAHSDLEKHGVGETYPALVRHLANSIPAAIAPTKCADIIAAYLTIREPK